MTVRRALRSVIAGLAVALGALAWASPGHADIPSWSAVLSSSTVRLSYTWTAPNPSAQPQVVVTDNTNPDARWVFTASSDVKTTSTGTIVAPLPRLVGTSGCTMCLTELVSTTTGLTSLPPGSYSWSMRFVNTMGATTTSPTAANTFGASATVPVSVPTLSSPTTMSGLGANALTLKYTLPASPVNGGIATPAARGAQVLFRGRGSAACDASLVNLILPTSPVGTENTISIPYATPTTGTNIQAGSSGTFIRGCTYDADLVLESSLRAPESVQALIGIVIPDVPSITNVQASTTHGPASVTVTWDLATPTSPLVAGQQDVVFTNVAGSGTMIQPVADGSTALVAANDGRVSGLPAVPLPATGITTFAHGLLAPGTYTVAVRAGSIAGRSVANLPGTITISGTPDAPTAVNATGGLDSATVSWTAGASNSSAITRYVVSSDVAGSPQCVAVAPSTSCTVPSLAPGTHHFTVVAENANGAGPASTPLPDAEAVVGGPPDAPTGVRVTRAATSATVQWSAARTHGGAITAYTVTASPGGASCTVGSPSPSASSFSCPVTGLANGTDYVFDVTATADSGYGTGPAATSGTVTPADVPDAPTGVAATMLGDTATITWDTPGAGAANGSAIVDYQATVWGQAISCGAVAPEHSCTIAGLPLGTPVTFVVTARNAMGRSTSSSASSAVTPALAPAAPTSVVAVATGTSVSVGWSAPSANGSTITGYHALATPGGSTCDAAGNAGACTIANLTAGTTYAFAVRASNALGAGELSEPTAPVVLGPAEAPAPGVSAPPATSASAGAAGPVAGAATPGAVSASARATKLVITTTAQVNGAGRVTQVGTASVPKGRKKVATTVCTATGSASAASGATLTCALNAAGKALAKKGAVRVTLVTTLTPDAGAPATATTTVTVPRVRR